MSRNRLVKDSRPTLMSASNIRPSLVGKSNFDTDRLYTQILEKGMYMGIPPFTYPETETVQSPFNP